VALSRLGTKLFTVRTLARAGVAKPARPDRLVRALKALRAWGKTPAAGYGVSAARYPDEPAIIDELGTITFAELDRRTNAIARRWKADGLGPGSSIAILCRNHRGFVEATLSASKTGADMLYLNT
jgi:fatty-acyl-CoA synthase